MKDGNKKSTSVSPCVPVNVGYGSRLVLDFQTRDSVRDYVTVCGFRLIPGSGRYVG